MRNSIFPVHLDQNYLGGHQRQLFTCMNQVNTCSRIVLKFEISLGCFHRPLTQLNNRIACIFQLPNIGHSSSLIIFQTWEMISSLYSTFLKRSLFEIIFTISSPLSWTQLFWWRISKFLIRRNTQKTPIEWIRKIILKLLLIFTRINKAKIA